MRGPAPRRARGGASGRGTGEGQTATRRPRRPRVPVPPPDARGEAGRGLRDAAEKTRSRFGGASRVLRMGVPHGSRGQCGVSPRASGSRGRFWPPRPSPWRHSRGLHRNPHRACLINASPSPPGERGSSGRHVRPSRATDGPSVFAWGRRNVGTSVAGGAEASDGPWSLT